ncbi:MAG: DUF3800 domain-containing protein [Phycisphaerae bacterium]|jgi:hypothetical protein
MDYYLFLDETGDHGLSYVDENFPIFLLCGCLVTSENLKKAEEKINNFKLRFFKTSEVILHSRDIRKCEGSFQILFDLKIKEEFYKTLNGILSDLDYCLIGSAINKKEHIIKYGKSAKDPYSIALSFILERTVFYLNSASSNSSVSILVEKRGKAEDKKLLSDFNSIMDRGTYYLSVDRLKKTIKDFSFLSKRENIVGLQIADLCAYPLARHLLNPKEPYIPFKTIEKKIYCDGNNRYNGWGLKVFP